MTGINMTAVIITGLICFTVIVLCAISTREKVETPADKPEAHREPHRAFDGMPDTLTIDALNKTCIAYENELKARMSETEFYELVNKIARETFTDQVLAMPNDEFREIILNHFDHITGSTDNTDFHIDDDEDGDT